MKIQKKLNLFLFCLVLFIHCALSRSAYAGVNIILDLDKTVLKDAPVEQKDNPHIQSVRYKPADKFYKRYQERLKTKLTGLGNDSGKVHYQLHEDTREMTGYIVVRPGMESFLKELTKDPTNKIYIVSSNDPARTQEVVHSLKIGEKTLEEWGATTIPKEVFSSGGEKKNLAQIRKWANLSQDSKLYAIDDHPEFYTEGSSLDHVIGITPWDDKNGVSQFLSQPSGHASQQIKEKNTQELQQILSKIQLEQPPQSSLLSHSQSSQSSSSSLSLVPHSQAPPSAFKISALKHIDLLKSLAKSPTASANDEFYSERPDIQNVTPQDHSNRLSSLWRSEREGHLEAVAEILEMYPDRHLYFLARDGELLYDYAKTVLADETEQLERIHLLNISRANMHNPHLLEYLAQEGISKENLEKGMKVMFVDTGFSGTIPKTISERFPQNLRGQLQTHLLCSSNPSHPSSRVFLEYLHKGAAEIKPSQLQSSIVNYEHMPRFTFRAQTFKAHHGKWSPTGEKGKDSDGQVNREQAQKYMEDLKFYALTTGKERWEKRRTFWRRARQLLGSDQSSDPNEKAELEKEFKQLLKSNDPLRQAIVRDFFETVQRNEPTKVSALPTLQSLGFTEIGSSVALGSKIALIQFHPEWKTILENPGTEIPKLVNGSDAEIQTLRNIIDVIEDYEVQQIISQSLLFKTQETHLSKTSATFESIMDKDHWGYVLSGIFNQQVHKNPKIVELALESVNPHLRRAAATSLSYMSLPIPGFKKALTDKDHSVRTEASISLRYRNASDPEILDMLVGLLDNSNFQIRTEVNSFIHILYPIFPQKSEENAHESSHEIEASMPLKAYLNSSCRQPIHEVLDPHALKEILDPIKATLTQDEPKPIILVSNDDPRVRGTPFAKLGAIYQIGGIIWSGLAKDENGNAIKMKYSNWTKNNAHHSEKPYANTYCESIGGRLPTNKELLILARAKGRGVPGENFEPGEEPKTKGQYLWSSCTSLLNGHFNGDFGEFVQGYLFEAAVLCVNGYEERESLPLDGACTIH